MHGYKFQYSYHLGRNSKMRFQTTFYVYRIPSGKVRLIYTHDIRYILQNTYYLIGETWKHPEAKRTHTTTKTHKDTHKCVQEQIILGVTFTNIMREANIFSHAAIECSTKPFKISLDNNSEPTAKFSKNFPFLHLAEEG